MLQLENVKAGYGKTEVLHNISFQLKKGENLCIIGPNGCGKSTLLKAIEGLVEHTGKIFIDDKELNCCKRAEIARKIVLMSQSSKIYFSYTVLETVLIGRYVHTEGSLFKRITRKDTEYAKECIARVGLSDVIDKQISELSGGQLQRVYLARVLAQEPEIILLDEPTNHLDLRYQVELIDYIKEWAAKNKKIVIGVFHDINTALRLAERALILNEGNTVFYGNTIEAIDNNIFDEIYQMNVRKYMQENLRLWQ